VPDHPDVRVDAETVAGTSFWWGHGTLDPAIPHTLATRGRTALVSAGAQLEKKDYPMGHGISPAELADAAAWSASHLVAR
jgi:phospholipase/carboxylesterase